MLSNPRVWSQAAHPKLQEQFRGRVAALAVAVLSQCNIGGGEITGHGAMVWVCFLCFRSSRMFSLYKSLWDKNFAHNLSISPSIYVGTRCILHTEVTLTVEIIFLATGFCC